MSLAFRSKTLDLVLGTNEPGLVFMGRKRTVTETPILGQGVNMAAIQLSDWGNYTLKKRCWVESTSRADWEGVAEGTSGTLSGVATFGGATISYTSVYLVNVEPIDGDNDIGYVGPSSPTRQEFIFTFKKLGP